MTPTQTTSHGVQTVRAIERILACRDTADYFGMLELERPSVDALGRPTWNVPPETIARAYRKASILVHPDKIATSLVQAGIERGAEHDRLCGQAREAFDALRQGRVALEDPGSLEQLLKASVARAKEDREREACGLATVEERVLHMSKELSEKKRLREEEYTSMNEEIRNQMIEKRKNLLMKKKRHEERLQRDRMDETRDHASTILHDNHELYDTHVHHIQNGAAKVPSPAHPEKEEEEEARRIRRRKNQQRRKKHAAPA